MQSRDDAAPVVCPQGLQSLRATGVRSACSPPRKNGHLQLALVDDAGTAIQHEQRFAQAHKIADLWGGLNHAFRIFRLGDERLHVHRDSFRRGKGDPVARGGLLLEDRHDRMRDGTIVDRSGPAACFRGSGFAYGHGSYFLPMKGIGSLTARLLTRSI
jgi:hypothetical protein